MLFEAFATSETQIACFLLRNDESRAVELHTGGGEALIGSKRDNRKAVCARC
jgi:hypothetical protein